MCACVRVIGNCTENKLWTCNNALEDCIVSICNSTTPLLPVFSDPYEDNERSVCWTAVGEYNYTMRAKLSIGTFNQVTKTRCDCVPKPAAGQIELDGEGRPAKS